MCVVDIEKKTESEGLFYYIEGYRYIVSEGDRI